METDIETKYCQSCGMPLDIEDISEYGTNSDGTLNQEFCSCCLNSGKYLFNFSMEYLIYLWGLFPDSYNQIAGTNYKSEELRNVLSDRLPNLKRWKQKTNTAHIHYDLIMNVQEYINRHLFEDLNCDNLSHVACMSMYHFRRIFKDVVGENVGDYIQRLRLEYIAFKLISTNTRVSELLEQINFQNKHTLSRAFKKHFQMSIPAFRKAYSNVAYENKIIKQLEYSIKRIKEIKVAYLKFERTHRNKQAYSTLWKQIMEFAKKYNLTDKGFKYVSISLDSLDITEIDKCRFLIGITVPYSMEIPKGFSVLNIQTGLYSVFNIKGRYHELNRIYRDIYLDWLPNSKYSLREQMTFEIYTNTPDKASMEELVTEIYLPIEVKQKIK
ncbi:GyrI-like domain-containing protein [Parabacteroides merdae]|jgi:DNA gyrase inhibitor GyrI/AraC-like DNA-binding protein|uniref:GyrI-like domain-containing protein n=1 Tax=Parabacteroides merdae TaxID=46503 RepID=UPI00189BDCE3|nr:GyrI-like domain-containing protein [Parabacteroides merdae]MCE9202154.1 GyrI-like domain-containing protein [Parabacteroides merdae]